MLGYVDTARNLTFEAFCTTRSHFSKSSHSTETHYMTQSLDFTEVYSFCVERFLLSCIFIEIQGNTITAYAQYIACTIYYSCISM
jgi:hypothetical protein